MKAARTVIGSSLLVASAFASSQIFAQAAGITRTDLIQNDLSLPGYEVVQALVEIGPGVVAPNHFHPGEEIAYVVEGSLEYELEGQAPMILTAGESLFIPAGTPHIAKNVGSGNAVELATYFVRKGEPLLTLK